VAAVKTTASVIKAGSDEVLTEGNWEHFSEAVPGNLKLIEGLWYSDPTNKSLLLMLIKGYGAYGFASKETIALKDIIEEEDESPAIDQAILIYEKAIFYGVKYLELSGISQDQFYNKSFSTKISKEFSRKFSSDDYTAILYFAQAMGSSINIQRQNVSKMALLSHVKAMLGWVCEKDPEIERGSCGLFNAVIEASTPTLLGGSQKRAKKLFKKLIKKQPYNLLARISYVQYHLIPLLEEEEFSVEMESLKKDIDTWYSYVKGSRSGRTKLFERNRDFNLYNSIAKKKYSVLMKLRKDIF
jgi:hypothetical protein